MGKNNTLGNRIKSRRQALNLSQSELAKQLNCTQAALSQYENGNREPGLNDLANIANCLHTTTDYLLGQTDIASNDGAIKTIGDYLGFTEASIEKLHGFFEDVKMKTTEEYLKNEATSISGFVPGEEGYDKDFNYIRTHATQDLEDYLKTINEFICSPEFDIFVSRIKHNLFLERHTYDMFRIVAKQYDKIESPVFSTEKADLFLSFSDDSEHNIQQYSLNLFDAQNAFIDFCRNFTQLEEVKRLDSNHSLFRKVHFFLYMCSQPKKLRKNTTFESAEAETYPLIEPLLTTITELLRQKK